MIKRRRLSCNQEVIIIYDKQIGYVKKRAIFQNYVTHNISGISHEIPTFLCDNKNISGLECFWMLPEEAPTDDYIHKAQYDLIDIQIKAQEAALKLGYNVPMKINDSQIKNIAQENVSRDQFFEQKFGFDIKDDSWIETELATTIQERNWFKFDRENGLSFSDNWDEIINIYNQQFKDSISIDVAKALSKKRMRYMLGAYNTRLSGNNDKNSWKQAAVEFENFHKDRENRMLTWSMLHSNNFPLVKTKKEIRFWTGPYFHQCIEQIPHIFTDHQCNFIKPNIVLRVLSYDKIHKYIRLDFTPDVVKKIKPDQNADDKPWIKEKADYDIWVNPEDIDTHLEILDSLE